MIALHEAGASTRQVSAEVGMHRQTVMRHLRRAGVTRYRVGLDSAGAAQARRLYFEGHTLAEVGALLGVAPSTIGWYLKLDGISSRPSLVRSSA